MDKLYKYFKDLSEGKLDITRTVEYQFVKALQGLDTPIGLEEFAAQVNLTSIILNFLGLTTNAGLFSQSQYGLDTTIQGSLEPKNSSEPVSDTSDTTEVSEESTESEPVPVFVPSRTPGDSLPERSEAAPRPTATTLTPVPEKTENLENAFEMDLPGHIRDRLNFERAKTGSKKSEDGSEGLSDLFDQLGTLELEE
ncbi:MAG: hypothetical protein ACXAE3_12800 [Candidatus Kariarchaeaceae archaeon]|jgi:hypothetical protein